LRTLLALVLLGLSSTAAAAAPPAAGPGRYLVFELEEGGFRPLSHRTVTMVGRTNLGPAAFAARLAADGGDDEQVGVELLDAAGGVLFRDVVRVPRWIRSEGPSDEGDGALHGALLPAATRPFVVRVPAGGSRLRLSTGARSAGFDVEALAADQGLALAGFAPPTHVEAHLSGSPANRVDMLYLGDGYRAEDAALFTANANQVADQFFGVSPYSDYRSHTNVAMVTVTSAEAGADHPPFDASCPSGQTTCCADPIMQNDPRAGQFVATALDATFCNRNIHRALVVNVGKALAAAAAYPDWDEVTVLVNDTTYGGTGGTLSTVSMNANAVEVARHELGHSFSSLADEYDSPFPGYPACNDNGGTPCHVNVTNATTRETIKWAPWIASSTPIPTPETSQYASVVGLFEGARYQPIGMYRPRLDCLMRALNRPFCEICRQRFVLALYGGPWGTPLSGVDPIEPGSEAPAPGATSGAFPGAVDFSTSLLAPTRGALSSRWSVDGRTIAGASGGSFRFVPGGPGPYTVRLDVSDPTPFVHPAMAGNTLETSRVWNVNVNAGGTGVSVAAVEPTSGPASGGTVITLRGGGFVTGTTVTVGGLAAGDVVVTSDLLLTARTPPTPAGQLHAVAATLPSNATFALPGAWLSDFIDVPQADPVHRFVERLVRNLVTGGCGAGAYCRHSAVTRAQMSIFLLRSRYGAAYASPAARGTVFNDVPASGFAAAYIEDLAARGVTGGCGGGAFCPGDPVTRASMAVFLLVMKHGTGYIPPAATGMFSDVPVSDPNAPWIEQLAREGITAGCGGGRFCPTEPVLRGDMAVFLSVTFGLP
jgi:hypothetical protein